MNMIRPTATAKREADGSPATLRVEDCELHVENGKLSVTFRLALTPPAAAAIASTPRRLPARVLKSKP